MLRIVLTVERFYPMTSYLRPPLQGRKLTAVALVCTVLVGLSGCNNQSVLSTSTSASSSSSSQRDPDRIYANHTEGVDPDAGIRGFKSHQEVDDYRALLRKWGLKQTPDWLAVCNQVNVPALRRVGFDPQKDLDRRHGGAEMFNCYWFRDNGRLALYFGRIDSSKTVRSNPKFEYLRAVKRKGETYYLGHVEYTGEGTIAQAFTCSLTFDRDGVGYVASFNGKDPKTADQACDDLMAMMAPRR